MRGFVLQEPWLRGLEVLLGDLFLGFGLIFSLFLGLSISFEVATMGLFRMIWITFYSGNPFGKSKGALGFYMVLPCFTYGFFELQNPPFFPSS